MTRDSELASFSPLSPKVKQISSNLIFLGNAGFWSQLVLGVFSLVLIILATAGLAGSNSNQNTQQSGAMSLAVFCASVGILILAISIFFFFFRYTSIGKALKKGKAEDRPKKQSTVLLIRLGIISSLAGILASLIGAETLTGILFGQAAVIDPGSQFGNDTQLINSLEIMILLANVHTIFSHFVGLVISLLLFDRINK